MSTTSTASFGSTPKLRLPDPNNARGVVYAQLFFNRIGRIRDRTLQAQNHRASLLNLVAGTVVLWNTTYL